MDLKIEFDTKSVIYSRLFLRLSNQIQTLILYINMSTLIENINVHSLSHWINQPTRFLDKEKKLIFVDDIQLNQKFYVINLIDALKKVGF